MGKTKSRESGIELLKILSMVIIVISHVTQTIVTDTGEPNTEFVFSLINLPSLQAVILAWLRTLGGHGNHIFFVCSAWFLVDSKHINKQKIFHIICDLWIVNVLFMLIFKFLTSFNITNVDIIKSLLPHMAEQTWYVTCYILLYMIHQLLNKVIDNVSQKSHLSFCLISLAIYYGLDYFLISKYFISKLIVFVVIYFTVAYIKRYMPNFCDNKKANIILLIIGLLGTPVYLLATNLVAPDRIYKCFVDFSPFYLITAIAALNLFRNIKFVNPKINYISSLSLLTYIIHENHLVRIYFRPYICNLFLDTAIYEKYIVVFDLLFAAVLFAAAMLISVIYKATIQKLVIKIGNVIYRKGAHFFNLFEDKLMKIK